MAKPRVMVLRAAGINCDTETQHAWELVGAEGDVVHVNQLLESPAMLERYAALTIPGGFSYGDDLGAGRILGLRLRLNLGEILRKFVERDRLVFGICNGFQVLVESGLLGANGQGERVALSFNLNGHYTCRWVTLQAGATHCAFLEPNRSYFLPMAHAEGRLVVGDAKRFDARRAALRYVEGAPRVGSVNPNGSFEDIAGLTDGTGRVLGLMPHPERFMERAHHPFWTAADSDVPIDGRAIFETAARNLRA